MLLPEGSAPYPRTRFEPRFGDVSQFDNKSRSPPLGAFIRLYTFLSQIFDYGNTAILTEQDKLVYVNNVIRGKLLESTKLRQQAANNTKEQFANSPDLNAELLNAIMGALDARTVMSTQALNSKTIQRGLKDILLNHARLWETLRAQGVDPKLRFP